MIASGRKQTFGLSLDRCFLTSALGDEADMTLFRRVCSSEIPANIGLLRLQGGRGVRHCGAAVRRLWQTLNSQRAGTVGQNER
jgi:hypothetical protein